MQKKYNPYNKHVYINSKVSGLWQKIKTIGPGAPGNSYEAL